MDFDAYKYARIFEKLACKIIEKELSEKIIVSGVTQKTRDNGIDAIIHSTDSFITIEAKLRKSSSSLGLKDIASSVIFYLLRLNNKHYIVSNVYLTTDTINVLNRLNETNGADISYIDGDSTIRILKENLDSLENDEQELANILMEEFNKNNKAEKSQTDNTTKKLNIPLLKSQRELSDQAFNELINDRKCVVLLGKTGTGKSVILNSVMEKLAQSHNTIFIDCQKYNTIEAFMYQISNLEIGIDINELITEYISLSDEFNNSNNLINIESSNIIKTLAQVFSTSKYVDNIKFLAKEYINNLIERFNRGNLYIFVDNYSAASSDLADFISSYIISSIPKLKFFIVREKDFFYSAPSKIDSVIHSPINAETFKELHVHEYDNNEIDTYIDLLRPNIPKCKKNDLYSYFGGNLLTIKLALNELKQKNEYDFSLLRPKNLEQIYADRIKSYIKLDNIYIKVFFVCWVMSSQFPSEIFGLFENCDVNDLLERTGLFNDTESSLSLCNICIYKTISEYFIFNRRSLYSKIKKFVCDIETFKMSPIEQIRVKFFKSSDDFLEFSNNNIPLFENKLERNNVLETRVLIYLYANRNDELNYIEAASNLLYDSIDCGTYGFNVDSLITDILSHLKEYFDEIDILGGYNRLSEDEKIIISHARIKYSLFLYFSHKRNNNFKQANNDLNIPAEYLLHCNDSILVSKIIRFQAICKKELGNRKEFLNILHNGVLKFPENQYLSAVYNANLAAVVNFDNLQKAIDIICDKALPAAECTDKYLALWILNDKLINLLFIQQYDNNQFKKEYNSIVFKSERLYSVTDRARAENTYGAFCLKKYNNRTAACECFKTAFYLMCRHENNNIAFYFAVNYIRLLPKNEREEFDYISKLLMDWCKNNIDYIADKIKDPNTPSQSNKLVMALYSLENALDKRKDSRHQLLINIREIADIFTNRISMNKTFYIRGIPIILF